MHIGTDKPPRPRVSLGAYTLITIGNINAWRRIACPQGSPDKARQQEGTMAFRREQTRPSLTVLTILVKGYKL